MLLSNEEKMRKLSDIQSSLKPNASMKTNFAYGCDCTGCSNACFESCDDGVSL